MEIRQSVLCQIASDENRVFSVDIGSLIRRLVLFDRVVIKSSRLREIPVLVRTFGKGGFDQLLKLGIVRFCCEFTVVVTDVHMGGTRTIPLDHFSFGIADLKDREEKLRQGLVGLQGVPGLKNDQRLAIEEAVWSSLVRPPTTFGADLLNQIDADLRKNSSALKASIIEQVTKERPNADPSRIQTEIQVEETQTRVFHIRNTISRNFGLSSEQTHDLLQRAVTGVASLNHRIAEMSAYSSITGFLQTEAPLLFGKLAGIVAPLNPNVAEEQFKRVLDLADVPDFKSGQRVDVEKLLAIRESSECRDFRGWLSTIEGVSDEDVQTMVRGVKNKLASLAGSTSGKAVRLAITTGLGLIPGFGALAGLAGGSVDSFLVDRVLPRSGVFAFLAESYPSLFVSA